MNSSFGTSRNAFTCSGSRVMRPGLPSFTSRLVGDHWKFLWNLIPLPNTVHYTRIATAKLKTQRNGRNPAAVARGQLGGPKEDAARAPRCRQLAAKRLRAKAPSRRSLTDGVGGELMSHRGVILLGVLIVGVISAAMVQEAVVPAPATWQPFDARIDQSTPGFPDMVGTFYRSSDGSERYDQALADGTKHLVTVMSVATGWQYACNISSNMCMRMQAESPRRIGLRRVTMPGLVSTDQQIEGFALYEYTDLNGRKSLQAPSLNFAELVIDDPATGTHRTLSHIALREPDPSLFQPPAGAQIQDMKPR
jgi:hypothetical protein